MNNEKTGEHTTYCSGNLRTSEQEKEGKIEVGKGNGGWEIEKAESRWRRR